MRIINEYGEELAPEDIDLSLGYLRDEKILINKIEEQSHIYVSKVYFDDQTSYVVESDNDPHIKTISARYGYFDFIFDKGDTRQVRGMDLCRIIDVPASEEYEDVQRYILYTEEELVQRSLPDRMDTAEETLQETGTNVEDLILLLAEVLGGEGEEEIPEEEEEPVDPDVEPEPSGDEDIEPTDPDVEPEPSGDEEVEPSPDDIEPEPEEEMPAEDEPQSEEEPVPATNEEGE